MAGRNNDDTSTSAVSWTSEDTVRDSGSGKGRKGKGRRPRRARNADVAQNETLEIDDPDQTVVSDVNQRKPRGNLPPPPSYDGARHKDPKGYRRYFRRVEGWYEIASLIIPEEEIGPRLFHALEGQAFDHFEGVKASTFAHKDGWKKLLKALEYFDERLVVKTGSAMDEFYGIGGVKDGETYADAAHRLDRVVQRCHDVQLQIAEPLVIRQFFKMAGFDDDKKALT